MPYATYRDRAEKYIRVNPMILAGGAALSAVAGAVNCICLGYFRVPVSHMSGAVSKLGVDLGSGASADLKTTGMIVLGFLCGAMFSGAVIGHTNLRPGKRYAAILLLESLVICAAMSLMKTGHDLGLTAAAFACGLQNAMASSYYGLIIRTTHVTGIVTDLGVLLGQALRFHRISPWKLAFLCLILAGFFSGGYLGTLAFNRWSFDALLLPAGAAAAGAVLLSIVRFNAHRRKRAAQAFSVSVP